MRTEVLDIGNTGRGGNGVSRLSSKYVVDTSFVDLTEIQSGRLFQRETLTPDMVITNFLPNSVAFIDPRGNIHNIFTSYDKENDSLEQYYEVGDDTKKRRIILNTARKDLQGEFHGTITLAARRDIAALIVVPKSPYGPEHIMICDVRGDEPKTILDDPSTQAQRDKLAMSGKILEAMLEEGGTAYAGNNISPACLDGIRSLQTVLYPHIHLWKFAKEFPGLTMQEIREIRNAQRWDEGISQAIGEDISAKLKKKGIDAISDKMGVTIEFPNMRPSDFGKDEFIDYLLAPIYKTMHEQISEVHAKLYTSTYDNVVDWINRERKDGKINRDDSTDKDYQRLFTRRTVSPDQPEPEYMQRLRDLEDQGKLRHPIGWTIGWQFHKTDEGRYITSMAITTGPMNEEGLPVGPAEGFGILLNRQGKSTDDASSKMEQERMKYKGLLQRAYARS